MLDLLGALLHDFGEGRGHLAVGQFLLGAGVFDPGGGADLVDGAAEHLHGVLFLDPIDDLGLHLLKGDGRLGGRLGGGRLLRLEL